MQEELPKNIELLTNEELRELSEQYKGKLIQFVSKFQPVDAAVEELSHYKTELLQLKTEFEELQKQITSINQEIDSLKVLNSQYVKEWQDVNAIVQTTCSEQALLKSLENKISELEGVSSSIEAEAFSSSSSIDKKQLEALMNRYVKARTDYYVETERLATWRSQGSLRKDIIKQ